RGQSLPLGVLLVACLLTAARAQAPAGTPPTGAQPAPAAAESQAPAAAQGEASPAQTPGSATKPPPVCFKLTGRCVEPAARHSGKANTATGTPAATGSNTANGPNTAAGQGNSAGRSRSAPRPLNLTAPDVRSVVPADQLSEPLPSREQITETQEADTV